MTILAKSVGWFIQHVSFTWGMRLLHVLNLMPKAFTEFETTVTYRGSRFHVFTREEIGHRLFYCGKYEPDQEDCFLSFVKPGGRIFDIGANIGIYSVLAASKGAEVAAFEPSPRAQKLLKDNIEMNNLKAQITVYPLAVSKEEGKVTFYEGHDRNWSVGRVFRYGNRTDTQTVEVDTQTLDRLAEKIGCPDVIKVDIEGAEWLALQGAAKLLARPDAPVFLMELHPGEIESLGGECFCSGRANACGRVHAISVGAHGSGCYSPMVCFFQKRSA